MKVTWVVLDDITAGLRNISTAQRATLVVPYMSNTYICSTTTFIESCDAVIFQDRFEPHDVVIAATLARNNKKIIIDISYPVWHEKHPCSTAFSKRCFTQLAKLSAYVTVPTVGYKNDLEKVISDINVVVVPTGSNPKEHEESAETYMRLLGNLGIRPTFTTKSSGDSLKLNLFCEGLMFGHSGFAEAMRNIIYSLYIKGCNITVKPHDGDNINILSTEKGKAINSLMNTVYNNNYRTVQVMMTHPMGVLNRSGEYQIGYVMFETQKTPKVFIDSLMANTDELWVPSTFNLKNFTEAGYKHPIFAMPLGVDTDRFNPDKVKPLDTGLQDKFVFLSIMGWSERKGISILVEAYLREFSSRDRTVLYLKGGWYDSTKAENEVAQVVSKVNKPDSPEVRVDFSLYSDAQLPGLYKSADCFVLASLGEGWGLNYTEAMSMGLPTIGTRCTSQVDFMTDKNSFLINVAQYRTEPGCDWVTPEYIGAKFAVPSMKHLQLLMRQVYTNPELAKMKGTQARKDMINKYQWKYAANKWFNRLKELEVEWNEKIGSVRYQS